MDFDHQQALLWTMLLCGCGPSEGATEAGTTMQAEAEAEAEVTGDAPDLSTTGIADASTADASTSLGPGTTDADDPSGDTGTHGGTAAATESTGEPVDTGDCDIVVELGAGPGQAPLGVAAGSSPLLCWVVPPGGMLPGPDGWDVDIYRTDTPGTSPKDAQWAVIRGVPPADTSVVYGECPAAARGCFGPMPLEPGEHVLTVWDGTRVGGLGGFTFFDVEE